jgi:poly-beta-1,6-N-acetyl-D-glucosamine synthase
MTHNAMKIQRYVLITPVRNEQDTIEGTLDSVLRQTVQPARWVIVSDSSTDRTDEIIQHHARQHDFIELIRLNRPTERSFAAKIAAFNLGYEALRDEAFDLIGNLDADVTFDPDYYEQIMRLFGRNPRLGIAGGIIMEYLAGGFRKQQSSSLHTPGATQVFRRQCFEEIGGYLPLKNGGEDSAADIMARMRGWQTQSFGHLRVFHHRRVGSGLGGVLRARYYAGVTDYNLGKHPVFMLAKSLRRLNESPCVLSSICRMAGFFHALARRGERPVPVEFIEFVRREQLKRLVLFH